MFGYACRETPELMPAPIMFAHNLGKALSAARKSQKIKWLRPDGKTQVSVAYEGYEVIRIDTIVISTQHTANVSHKEVFNAMKDLAMKALPAKLIDRKTRFLVNPTGRFVIGGPQGDAGLTGRKIIVDSYGGMGRHGGGAFSGKDPSKVDRSAAYMGRYVAKNVVASGLADRCEVQFAYAIGFPEPVSLSVNCFGTSKVSEEKIEEAVRQVFSFKPANIIKQLDLLRPIYSKTTNYGHFGKNDKEITWEKIDKVKDLLRAVS
jgi:S-adenosylmethionine synthetase